MNTRTIVGLCIVALVIIFGIVSVGSLVEYLAANEIMVIQAPFSGHLSVYTLPGVYWQGYGTVTHYQKREQFSFSSASDQGAKNKDESLQIRFNDGGHASISGVISWEMPVATDAVIKLHTLFGSQHAIEQQLVRPAIERAVYLTGPLMNSQESFGARRAELLRFIEDQARDGIYQTETINVKMPDPITGQEKTVQQVKLIMKNGLIERQGTSPIHDFSIALLPPSINNIKYDPIVEQQIKQQQENFGKVQIAQAQSREAEQRALTAEKNGQAEAATARWKQEVVKATEVTAAQQRLAVAELDARSAEQYKRKQILEGEGEAAKRQLVMQADGALDRKLQTYERVQSLWAQAFANFHGAVVPQIITGGGGGNNPQTQNAAVNFMELMGVKAAKDLAVDLQATSGKGK